MVELGEVLERDLFLLQYQNVLSGPRRAAYLCFKALSVECIDSPKSGYFCSDRGVHAEMRFLENLKTLDCGLSYTVTCYFSWSPCANCSKALVKFLSNNLNVNLRIFVSRLYRIHERRNREGLKLLNDAGVHLKVMNNEHFEYCWKTFVDHQQRPFPPWDNIVENHAHYQEELTDILQQNGLCARDGVRVLIVGTSMVRHVDIPRCSTSCHPCALIREVDDVMLHLLAQCPSIAAVVVHVGTWDHKLLQSEKLKDDYISLISTIQDSKKRAIVSGPFVPPYFGDLNFSRVRQLHICLKRYCMSKSIPYVDNFTTFLNRPYLFKADFFLPNHIGSHLLSMNIELTLLSCDAFSNDAQ
ncbi:DNA dC-_dU-editing enzyme APOBEC-3G isoform X1 [Syngnathus scovelli]|uniref:DNA dC->dU-editing enzyme APOBEC-3G isoform X1 n=1 Tax=Syngnathus scovelli TaxID=161590 RepID=UPI00210F9A88|nr:DNA dC->dU-editing enzyme APOBEC-3G isoform X1 [Syngnathus scovelli]